MAVPQKKELSFSFSAILQLTWPQVMVMCFFFCLQLTDVWTAGRLGNDIQAAFGMAAQGNMFLQVVAMALGGGATAAISQAIGAGLLTRAVRYVNFVLLAALVSGAFLAVLAYAGRYMFFGFLQTPPSILPVALEYWSVTLCTLPLGYLFSTSTTLFRATRQVIPPVFVAFFMALANLGGNLAFGLGYFGFPNYGYMGIAWTTFVCTGLGALANILLLVHSGYFDYKKFPPIKWIRAAVPYLLKVALPAAASQLVWQSGYVVLFAVTASLPFDSVHAIAGLTAGMRLEALLFLPGMGFSTTASVMVGNSLGAKNEAQAQRIALIIMGVGALCMSLVALVLWPFIPQMAAFLTDNALTQSIAEDYLYINFFSTPFTLISMILGGVMVGAGATRYNLLVYGTSFWVVRLPVAWILGHFVWQSASGVFVGMLSSQVVQSLVMLGVLFYAPWKSYAVQQQKKKKNLG